VAAVQLVGACAGTGASADGAVAPSRPAQSGIELKVEHDGRSLQISQDLASLVFGRAAAPLVVRLRWVLAVIASLGAPTPTIVTFAVHWASGGVGQFAIAYEWPLWLEVWWCVGWWVTLVVVVLLYGSLQRELAWIAFKQPSTLWIIAMCGLWGAGFVSLHDFGIQRSTWVTVPLHVTPMLFFPLVAMADAMPPAVRLSAIPRAGLPWRNWHDSDRASAPHG